MISNKVGFCVFVMRLRNDAPFGANLTGIDKKRSREQLEVSGNQMPISAALKREAVCFAGASAKNNALTLKEAAPDIAKVMAPHYVEVYGSLTASTQALTAKIKAGKTKELQDNFYFGVICKEGDQFVATAGMKDELQSIAAWLKMQEAELPSAIRQKLDNGGLAVVLQIQPPQKALEETISDTAFKSINHQKIQDIQQADKAKKQQERQQLNLERAKQGKPPLPNPPEEEEDDPLSLFKQYVFQEAFSTAPKGDNQNKELVAWPILQQLMMGVTPASKDVSKQVRKDAEQRIANFKSDLKDLNLYQLKVLGTGLPEDALQANFQSMSDRLAAFKLAQKHYVDSLEVNEVWKALLGGIAIGGGGETALEMAHLDNSPAAGWMRSGLLVVVDAFDNMLAQIPNVKQKIAKNNWTLDAKGITGDNSFGEYAKRMFSSNRALKGPAGPTVKDATNSAILGAGSGSVFAIPAGKALSRESESAWSRALMGGFGALGTSLSLPFKLLMDKQKTEAILKQMNAEGLIAAKEKELHQLALQDAMAGTGNAASLKAFSLVPLLSGSLLALEKVGIPRKWTQKLYMSISPGAENLLSLILMVIRQYGTSKSDMKAVEKAILLSNQDTAKEIDSRFSSGWGNAVGTFVTHPAVFFTVLSGILVPMYLYAFAGKLLGKGTDKTLEPKHELKPVQASNETGSNAKVAGLTSLPQATNIPKPPTAGLSVPATMLPRPLAPAYPVTPWNVLAQHGARPGALIAPMAQMPLLGSPKTVAPYYNLNPMLTGFNQKMLDWPNPVLQNT
jgi:hypothetical protein